MSENKQWIIGIDLGTTNCTLAFAEFDPSLPPTSQPLIHQFSIPQLAAAGEEQELPSLPSFLYFPLQEELKAKSAALSWDAEREFCVGTFGRDRGGELPDRLISSAKSWLCHSGVDRRSAILPPHADESPKMSPLEVTAHLLRHLKEAWDTKMPEAPFVEQKILVTVPASFDPSARELVQEAARLANYPETILLEEPQAAFYAWMHQHHDIWRNNLLQVGDSILVVDIGGGTTDFSLISILDEAGNLTLKRQAVGSHLLLGGDNLDLSLAYLAQNKLEEQGHHLDERQLQALTQTCRHAKELLMSENPPKHVDVTVMGRGSKLIGGSLKTKITLAEAKAILVDGFYPLIAPEDRSPTEKRLGLQQIGLPYAQDPRITSQLAKFLSMTGEGDRGSMEEFVLPSKILFNGGTMKAQAFQDRFVELLNNWATTLNKAPIQVLPNPDLDFAVSRGAVYYGLARQGKGIRIKSGTSRSYYIGVEDAVPAIPGMPTPLKAICVVPFGMEEGSEKELPDQEFSLVVGEPTTFRFFSHATQKFADGTDPEIGTIIKQWKQELTELPPIETFIEKMEGDGKTLRVKLKSRVTELGTLELWCVSSTNQHWKLEFDLRQK
ncbi:MULTISPECIES: Hsp70 family protein [Parachlamydia]|jgi:molecular chaperone DnaK (HSP70)|nr:Hsp70 family protein [Parachlamydia acanthamoebae]EFB41639.1 hypothetical protein pah_c026o077 [Parachlamydia acanthamoebae str. Hall's coccus]